MRTTSSANATSRYQDARSPRLGAIRRKHPTYGRYPREETGGEGGAAIGRATTQQVLPTNGAKATMKTGEHEAAAHTHAGLTLVYRHSYWAEALQHHVSSA